MNLDLASVITVIGATINVVVLLGIVLKGGQLLGIFQTTLQEVEKLRDQNGAMVQTMARTVAQLDALEGRVERLERQRDRA